MVGLLGVVGWWLVAVEHQKFRKGLHNESVQTAVGTMHNPMQKPNNFLNTSCLCQHEQRICFSAIMALSDTRVGIVRVLSLEWEVFSQLGHAGHGKRAT